MCLLIAKLANSTWIPSKEEQTNAWNSNPHGFGAAWINRKGELVYQKTLRQKDVAGIIRSIPKASPCLLHWRLATHGEKTVENCHPFPCFGGNWIGAHNGVLSRQVCIGDKTDSESFLMTLEGDSPDVEDIEQRVDVLGYGKLAFLSNMGEIRIANEDEGSWRIDGEVWQSNGGLDSVPWFEAYPRGFGFGLRQTAVSLVCDYCHTHAPLWQVGSDLMCKNCK